MKEIFVIIAVSISSIFILGYSVHMLIGGLVSTENEQITIAIVCTIGAIIVGFLIADIFKQRRLQRQKNSPE